MLCITNVKSDKGTIILLKKGNGIMKKTILTKVLTLIVLCAILSSSVNMNVITETNGSQKKYIVISKANDNYSVNTYSLTPYEASKLKQSGEDILVVAEDGYVKGSQA